MTTPGYPVQRLRLPEEITDAALHGMIEAGCCTLCAREVLVGAAIQWRDQKGRDHRHCQRCHGALMNAHEAIEGELAASVVQEIIL